MVKTLELDSFELGVCYYPEHWDKSLWSNDFRRMKEMGFTVIRIAEFAWSVFEPEEGIFQFDFFDEAIDLAHHYGLKVIIGTPTATPPAWLTYKYPEVLNVSQEGVTYQHGMRRHYNHSSLVYRDLCAKIVTKMVEHYKNHPAVIGWQIDNEFNCEINVFYAEADHLAFREWLKNKYSNLEKLNSAWGTVFWNQTYSDWEQVFLPRPTTGGASNPHQVLDEKRFISDNIISFAKVQADIIRQIAPKHFITTNGIFGNLNNHKITTDLLDFFSYDSYPLFGVTTSNPNEKQPLRDRKWSLNLSVARSISGNFAVMEQQAGPGGSVNPIQLPSPKPGQIRLWSYQSILHGADMLVYFRWRTATVGTEIYWHGINDYHNQPNRRVKEVQQIGDELTEIGNQIVGSKYQATVAIIKDYDNEWDGSYDKWHGPLTEKSVTAWFKALQYNHIPTDILYLQVETKLEELQKYNVLVYPHGAILTDESAELLEKYVRLGGKVIYGCRTGYKNIHGHANMRPLPGPVASLCGISVEEFTIIEKTAEAPTINFIDGSSDEIITADLFNDILHVENDAVQVVAEYASDYYAKKPALTKHKVEDGEAWYYGAVFNYEIAKKIIDDLNIQSPVTNWLALPQEVELGIRKIENKSYVFLLNYSNEAVEIVLVKEKYELLKDKMVSGKVKVEGYGVMILA